MKHQLLMFAFVLFHSIALSVLPTQGQEKVSTRAEPKNIDSSNAAPMIDAWDPQSASIDSIIELRGYRLFPGESNKSQAIFIQNGVEIPGRISGGSSVTNDQHNGAQTLKVVVPEEVNLGPSQVVIQANGQRSLPVAVMITEWQLPRTKRLTPTIAAPGTFVQIECDGFHVSDEIEITDATGQLVSFNNGGSSHCTGFGVPKDAPEGVFSVRLGNRKYGKNQTTEPFTLFVTNDPLPLELSMNYTKPVAPGQWLDLQTVNNGILKHSELTEVEFKQAGRTIVVTAPRPFRPHVEVPGVLTAGEAVELRARTWRDNRPSAWSQPVSLRLADRAVAPSVAAIRLGKGNWVHLWPGPDRASSFTVSGGDEVVLNGLWPVADAGKLSVLLMRPGEVITLTAAESDPERDWFSDVQVRLPESLAVGEWRMVVVSDKDGTSDEVPLMIRVVKK